MKLCIHISYNVIRKDTPIFNIKRDRDEIRRFSKYGHNFLMRYPDSFGQIIKKIAIDLKNIMLKSQLSVI